MEGCPIVYQDLNPEERAIRLLHLLPRRTHVFQTQALVDQGSYPREEPRASCTISHASLDQPPPYTALSYTWGDPTIRGLILVDGLLVSVTKNLEDALVNLMRDDEPVTLWVDSLCINQADDLEKTHQVRQMHHVYSEAASVLIWLGPEADGSDSAMRWIQRYGSLAYNFGIGAKPELRLVRLMQEFESNPDNLQTEALRDFIGTVHGHLSQASQDNDISIALSKIFKRPYWSRSWVVQEVVMGKDISFVCGNVAVSEEQLHHSQRLLRNYRIYQECRAAQSPPTEPEPAIEHIDTRNAINMLKLRRSPQPFPLIYLIRTLRFFLAGDPRDRIISLLNFAADAEELRLRADYRKSVKEIYIETTRALIKNGYSDILALCEVERKLEGLPSWVPDLTSLSHRSPLQQRATKRGATKMTIVLQPKFNASGNTDSTHALFESSEETSSLLLRAKLVDKVKRVGSIWESEGLSKWLLELIDFSRPDSKELGADQLKSVWRIAVAGQEVREGNEKPRLSHAHLQEVHEKIKSLDLTTVTTETFVSIGLRDYAYQLQNTAVRRRPFCTAQGLIGIGPRELEPGDLLYVLVGVDTLYVLRKDKQGRLSLLGEAYVDGIMDGEVLGPDHTTEEIRIC